MRTISKQQAKKFILLKQGLCGKHRFTGENGILAYVGQAGCIQFDPIDICGKNHELVLQSRVKNFKKKQLFKLLYTDRVLFDWFDKNMSIICLDDWPYLDSFRNYYKNNGRGKKEIDRVAPGILDYIKREGPICSADIHHNEKVNWYWAPASLARVALDTLYFRGDLVIHHKKNTRKYYDLATRHIPQKLLAMPNPKKTIEEMHVWSVLRRINSVGMLWCRASDAWLGIGGFKAAQREAAFEKLLSDGLIREILVEDIKYSFYYAASDENIMINATGNEISSERTEFMAPLDNMLWDRKLIKEIFGFEYKWEIYTPAKDRKYGYYVLPILHGNNFAGRIEIIKSKDSGNLEISNIWPEEKTRETKKLYNSIDSCMRRFNIFYKS